MAKLGARKLYEAAQRGQLDRVKELLAEGYDASAPLHNGDTPLHTSAAQDYVEIVQLLIDAGADLEAVGDSEMTPLFAAASGGSARAVEALASVGANVNADDARRTALFNARSLRDSLQVPGLIEAYDQVIRVLEKYGAVDSIPAEQVLRNEERSALPMVLRERTIAHRRGVISFDYDNEMLLIRKSVAATSRALQQLRDDTKVYKDVQQNGASLSPSGCFVFQLRGHSWSVVVYQHHQESLAEEAPQLSKSILGEVIYYRVEDCSERGYGAIDYALYASGIEQEQLRFNATDAQEPVWRKWTPGANGLSTLDCDDPWRIVDALFEERSALEPNVTFGTFLSLGETSDAGELELGRLFSAFKRIDYLALE